LKIQERGYRPNFTQINRGSRLKSGVNTSYRLLEEIFPFLSLVNGKGLDIPVYVQFIFEGKH